MNIKTPVMNPANHLKIVYLFTLTLLLSLMFFINPVFAANGVNVDSNGLAIKGYDPVAYFTMSKPVKGKKEFTVNYKGNKWALSSDVHKQAFLANPEAYLPQYGGFCAFAASKNSIAKTDPEAWTIHNNKLYLNYSKSVRSIWVKDKPGNIIKADGYWPELMKQVP